MDARWSVEVYHREVKQNCGIERCQARTSRAQRKIIFFSLFLRGLNNINVVYLKK
nr:transposase [Candidatus Arsenophonus triatominarum]